MAENEAKQPASAPKTGPSKPGVYDEAMIRVLDDVEHVRTRPGMYIGGYNTRGLHHLVYEIVDNSIDEALAGFSKSILVKINADGSCTVIDDGRGIPVGIHPTEGIPAVEIVFSTLAAGGKFEHNEASAYKTSGGLHGVGASVVNFVSEWMEIEVSRDGAIHHMEFERGIKTSSLKVIGKSSKTGTKVTFKPDPTLFTPENGGVSFVHETLANRLRELAFLNGGVEIVFEDERVGKKDLYKFEDGLKQYVAFLNEGKVGQTSIMSFNKEDPALKLVVDIGLQYNDGYNETILTFANNINNHDGGTHLSGFKTGLTNSILRHAERNNWIKDMRPTGDDLREGLVAIVSVKIPEPQFESQTKDKLLNVDVESFVQTAMNERMGAFLEENPKEAKLIFEKGTMAAEAREAAKKARELTRRKNSLEGNSLPGKLSDCRSKSNENTELFLVEGDSAAGTSKQGRDSETQAILALRGKILNVEKATLVKMLGHEEIRTIISALGCGIGEDFDLEKRRYGRVVIMTDADVDGSHIRTLLLTFFFRHMQKLIKAGRIFVAQPPLYMVTRKKKDEYVLNDGRMNAIYTELGLESTSLIIRDGDDAKKVSREIHAAELRRVIDLLQKLDETVRIVHRRGILFEDVLAFRAEHRALPRYNRIVGGVSKLSVELPAISTDDASETNGHDADQKIVELHELKDAEEVFDQLRGYGISIDDYYLTQEESVTGEKLATKYAFVQEEKSHDVAGVSQMLPEIYKLGKQGIEVKRFKGLGEMNAEQLWETTLDPSKRVLLRVTLEEAGEAERMFSVLMGEDVERRRKFIEDHALEVKNLDV